MEPIHFFRAGQHTTSSGETLTFSEADLTAIAAAYDATTHEAPIVVGHPKVDAPAYGWVEKVVAKADGLHAVPRQLNPEFAESVRSGAFKKVSAAFYRPQDKNNPKPGAMYLRHIGFLGAEPPAVKGLKDVQFAEGADIFFAEEDRIALREHSLAMREREFRRSELNGEIRKAVTEGRLPIGLLSETIAFAESLSDDRMISFSEGDETVEFNQERWFVEFLAKLPVPVDTRELAGVAFDEGPEPFDAPEGYSVNQRSALIHEHATRIMATKAIAYSEAAREAELIVSKTY